MSRPYYERGGITIYHGDALEVLPTLDLGGVALTLTDPPYNVGLDYADGDRRADYPAWSRQWFELVPRPLILTPGIGNLALWCAIEPPLWVCCWHKPNAMTRSAVAYANTWEPLLFYGKPPKRPGQDSWSVPNSPQTDTGNHPCPKPYRLWRAVLASTAEPGNLILDPFVGSGTTLRAGKELGMRAIGIEVEERYCEIAAKRLAQEVMTFDEAVA